MKKLIILLTFISVTALGQTLEVQTIYDTTRADGQRFIITMPYDCQIWLKDSVPGYYSLVDSYAVFTVNKLRIIGGDTISRGESVVIPLYKIGTNATQFLTGAKTRNAIRKETKPWINRKLRDE